MNTDKHTPGHIKTFGHGGKAYQHVIYCSDDDRVELQEAATGKTLLIFTANCLVTLPNGTPYGRFSMVSDNRWKWKPQAGTGTTYGTDLLAAEVEVSLIYLTESAK